MFQLTLYAANLLAIFAHIISTFYFCSSLAGN